MGPSTSKNRIILLVPGAVPVGWLTNTAKEPLEKLETNLRAKGYSNVKLLSYDNNLKSSLDQMEKSLTDALTPIYLSSSEPVDIIAHSMGQYVAMAAILKSGLWQKTGRLIGLAGVAGGASRPPFGCGYTFIERLFRLECAAVTTLILGEESFSVDKLKEAYQSQLSKIKKCSLAVRDDAFLDPADSGFFPDGANTWVEDSSHTKLPADPAVILLLEKSCEF